MIHHIHKTRKVYYFLKGTFKNQKRTLRNLKYDNRNEKSNRGTENNFEKMLQKEIKQRWKIRS